MLNYHKTYRESLDKVKRRPTPKKQPTINRSHTSSINLKISSDLDQLKGSIKNLKQNNDPYRKQSIQHTKSKSNIKNQNPSLTNQFKYSFKLKQDSDFYQGSRVRMKTNYQQSSCVKPFRQSNRCLITDRNQVTDRNQKFSDYKHGGDKSAERKHEAGHLRTQYKQNLEAYDFGNNQLFRYQQNQTKNKRELSTKHNTQSINSNSNQTQTVKVPLSELKKMYEQVKYFQNQVTQLQKQLSFYRKTSNKQSKNSVFMALAQ